MREDPTLHVHHLLYQSLIFSPSSPPPPPPFLLKNPFFFVIVFCLLVCFLFLYTDLEVLGAPNCASIPTTQICFHFPPLSTLLFAKFFFFNVCFKGNSKILEIWVFVSRLIFINSWDFHVSEKKPISDLSAPPSLSSFFLGSSNQTPFTLSPLSLYDSC